MKKLLIALASFFTIQIKATDYWCNNARIGNEANALLKLGKQWQVDRANALVKQYCKIAAPPTGTVVVTIP